MSNGALSVMAVGGAIPVSFMTTGCNGTTVAQDIVNWTPALESSAATVAASASILLPADAILIAGSLAAFNAAANLISAEAKAYLANPGQTTLQALQTGVITFQQQINAALLAAAKIVNPQSQLLVTNGLNAAATIINSIFALITQIKGNTVAATAAKTASLIRLKDLPDRSRDQYAAGTELVANHYNVPVHVAENMYFTGILRIQSEGF